MPISTYHDAVTDSPARHSFAERNDLARSVGAGDEVGLDAGVSTSDDGPITVVERDSLLHGETGQPKPLGRRDAESL